LSRFKDAHPDRYKWIVLTNTTIGMLMAMVNSSIILISLPNIFKGIGINPLSPGNIVNSRVKFRTLKEIRVLALAPVNLQMLLIQNKGLN
jgi:hypothetical protein